MSTFTFPKAAAPPRAFGGARIVALLACLLLAGSGFADVSVLSPLASEHEVRPGAVIEDAVLLRNRGAVDAAVRIYQTDYGFAADGSNGYPAPGTLERSNAAWIDPGADRVVVPAGETLRLPYRIRVPQRSDLNGSYWSVIMIESVGAADAPAADAPVAVRTALRYGVQIVTEFGDSGERLLRFTNPDLQRDASGRATLQVDAENHGERLLRSSYYAEIYDGGGALRGRAEGRALRTYPGTSVRQRFDLGTLPPDRYTVLVIADGGGDDVFGAQYTLALSAD